MITSPNIVKIIAPACVDSTAAKRAILLLAKSVATKNNIVAITPEKIANNKICKNCGAVGSPVCW